MAGIGERSPPWRADTDAEILLAHVAAVVGLVDESGRWVRVSPAVEAVLGYAPEDLVGRSVGDLFIGEVDALFVRPRPSRTELQARGRDGELRWLEVDIASVPPVQGSGRCVVTARDITRRRDREEQLTADVLRDPLTGLANRAHFETVVTHVVQRLHRRQGMVAVLFMDLDRFKDINDEFGHAVGDAVLLETAHRLCRILRDEDVAARVGGDEFLVCCQDLSDLTEVRTIADRARQTMAEPFPVSATRSVDVSASVGVAVASRPVRPGRLLAHADSAMYRAKRAGDGAVVIVHTDVATAGTAPPLDRALRRHELRLAYQPVVRVGDGRVVATETLLRWRHPRLGLVSPWSLGDRFGVIDVSIAVSLWVVSEVAVTMTAQQAEDDMSGIDVSLNVGVTELTDARFIAGLLAAADRGDVGASRLCVEVRDGPDVTGVRVQRALSVLQDGGVGLIIDGFPGSPSSLSELEHLRPRALKLHPRLMTDIERCCEARDLVGALASISRSFGTVAVATGVERPEQEALLRPLGIDLVQGNYVSPPLPGRTFLDRYAGGHGRFVPPSPPLLHESENPWDRP